MATIPFVMHPKLLRDVIERQAGSLWKAVLEGVMNSIEAGAHGVDVTVDPLRLRIHDDGQGFTNREQLRTCFETFGQPHEASEKKVWAQFRMGRGQMFAHGRNVWRSGVFRMTVDIATSLGYDLEEDLPVAPGCCIDVTLREGISDAGIHHLQRDITRAVLFVGVPVRINGMAINTPPEGMTWDASSTDDAYVRLKPGAGGIDVYNLGVYVQTIPSFTCGLSGVIVSRKRLLVNFARNDVMGTCPVWRRIRAIIDSAAGVERATATRLQTHLSEEKRLAAIDRLQSGQMTYEEFTKLRLLIDVVGEGMSSRGIRRSRYSGWTFAARDDVRADRLAQERRLLVLDAAALEPFKLPLETVLHHQWTLANGSWNQFATLPYVPFTEAAAHLTSDQTILPPDAWTPRERAWLDVLTWTMGVACQHQLDRQVRVKPRRLLIGLSTACNAWTDGATYIALSRENNPFTSRLTTQGRIDLDVLGGFLTLLAHEFAHDAVNPREHDRDFYRRFHDLVRSGFATHALFRASRTYTPVRIRQVLQRAKLDPTELAVDLPEDPHSIAAAG